MGNTASFTNNASYSDSSPTSLNDEQLEKVAELLKRSLLGDAITIPGNMSPRQYFASTKNTKSSTNLNSVIFNSKINKTDLRPMRGYGSCNELSKAGEKYVETSTPSSEGSTTSQESINKDESLSTTKRSKNSMSTPAISKNNSLLIPKKLNPIKIPNASSNTTVVPFIKVESPELTSSPTPKEITIM